MCVGLLRLVFAVKTGVLGAWALYTGNSNRDNVCFLREQPMELTTKSPSCEPTTRPALERHYGLHLYTRPFLGVQAKLQMKRPSENSPGSSPFAYEKEAM